MRRPRIYLLFIMLCCCASSAFSWNKPGHMVTGAIAYYELRERDPQALSRVIALLKRHPFYESEWLRRINKLSDTDPNKHDLYLFMYAARWPDDVRGTNLHCEKCHYVNYPYKPEGQPGSVHTVPPANQNIVQAYSQKLLVVQGHSGWSQKAQALCWMFHLVGDIHQPLHTTAIFTVLFPVGDRGGTRFYVRPDEDSDTQHLHSFWDGLVQRSQQFGSVSKKAKSLRAREELQRDDLPELSETRFERWARIESFALAVEHGYLAGELEGSADESDGEVLPEGYALEAKRIAEKRAVLAGYRLADVLSKQF